MWREVVAITESINLLFHSQLAVFKGAFSVFGYVPSNNLDLKLKLKVVFSNCDGSRDDPVDSVRRSKP
jgi:hypothetical protein